MASFDELKQQLQAVLQGAIRKILSSYDLHQVMTDRATFGDAFTREVSTELENWVTEGLNGMMDLFSAKGGLAVGGALEAFSNTPRGARVVEAFTKGDSEGANA